MGQPRRNLLDEARLYRAFLVALNDQVQNNPESIFSPLGSGEVGAVPVPSPTASRLVFIIHGHEELNLLRLQKKLKDAWDLDSVVLKEKPGKGRTLIEKFEEEAQAATFSIALLSPDDLVTKKGEMYPQARPNVVFELGWFYGRLGRERVCILLKEGTKIHSDLDGISRIEFKDSVEEAAPQLEGELKAAGLL
jgi:predicted nucleotide-binding protein